MFKRWDRYLVRKFQNIGSNAKNPIKSRQKKLCPTRIKGKQMKKIFLLLLLIAPWGVGLAQHTIQLQSGEVLKVKIAEIGDNTITYRDKKANQKTPPDTVRIADIKSYRLNDGIVRNVHHYRNDTIVSLMIDEENTILLNEYAQNQNKLIAQSLRKTGIISMSVGLPVLAAGISTLVAANCISNPTNGYTTSHSLANESANLTYMPADEYISKMKEYNGLVKTLENTGYICTGVGSALTLVSIPLYCYGEYLLNMDINFTGNGAGLSIKF